VSGVPIPVSSLLFMGCYRCSHPFHVPPVNALFVSFLCNAQYIERRGAEQASEHHRPRGAQRRQEISQRHAVGLPEPVLVGVEWTVYLPVRATKYVSFNVPISKRFTAFSSCLTLLFLLYSVDSVPMDLFNLCFCAHVSIHAANR
jgi:hypothetical protein